jgi:hypothetical protein
MQIHQIKSERKEIRFGSEMRSISVLNRGDRTVYCELDGQFINIQPGAQLMASSTRADRIWIKCDEESLVEIGFWPHVQTLWVIKEMDEVAHNRSKVQQDQTQEDEGIQYILKAKVTREKLVDLEPEVQKKEPVLRKIKRKLLGN